MDRFDDWDDDRLLLRGPSLSRGRRVLRFVRGDRGRRDDHGPDAP